MTLAASSLKIKREQGRLHITGIPRPGIRALLVWLVPGSLAMLMTLRSLTPWPEVLSKEQGRILGYGVIGAIFVLLSIVVLLDSRHIEVSDRSLRVYHRPLPHSGWRLPAGAVIKLTVELRGNPRTTPLPHVIATTDAGDQFDVSGPLPEDDLARVIQREVAQSLGSSVTVV